MKLINWIKMRGTNVIDWGTRDALHTQQPMTSWCSAPITLHFTPVKTLYMTYNRHQLQRTIYIHPYFSHSVDSLIEPVLGFFGAECTGTPREPNTLYNIITQSLNVELCIRAEQRKHLISSILQGPQSVHLRSHIYIQLHNWRSHLS